VFHHFCFLNTPLSFHRSAQPPYLDVCIHRENKNNIRGKMWKGSEKKLYMA